MPAALFHETCPALPKVSQERRQAILAGATDSDTHGWLYDEIAALRLIEWAPGTVGPPAGTARILFWNVERGRHPEAQAALLAGQGAAVNLLCELDHGMTRTGQRHTTRDLAERLGQGYAYGVEFLELERGSARELVGLSTEPNALGLHGNAILSPHALSRPVLIRLEREGEWFDGTRGERRVGGRMALAATLAIGGVEVVVATVHFESHSDPDHRADQMAALLDAIERYAPGMPAIVGGDFNTASASRDLVKSPGGLEALLAEDPDRLMQPMPYEPLFEVAHGAGYDWVACNDDRPTQRRRPDQAAKPPGRIDWFFTRGLAASDPVTIPALDPQGVAISDHDALAVTIRPDR